MNGGIHSLSDFYHRFLCRGHMVFPISIDLKFPLYNILEPSLDEFLHIQFIYGIFLMIDLHPHYKMNLLEFEA